MTAITAPVHASLTPDSDNWVPFINIRGEVAGSVLWLRNTTVNGLPLQSGIWRLLPGEMPETVPYVFPGHETIHILEGAVTIKIDGQEPVHLEVGDSAYFEANIVSTFTFTTPFRKLFHIS